jgi:cell cycle checkpoint protein
MAPRPAKRQRRSTLVLSDDDGDDDYQLPSSKAGSQREITLDGRTSQTVSPVKPKRPPPTKRTVPKSSPKSSPEKTKKNPKTKGEPEKSRSINSFFSKATEEQRWQNKAETPLVDLENGELDDAIEDDELSDDTLRELGLKTNRTGTALDRRKPIPTTVESLRGAGGGLPPSQRFVKPTAPGKDDVAAGSAAEDLAEGHRPWADRYGPGSLDELVVHKKKVADVQHWLQGRRDGANPQRLLVLKGPAGSGKTTTVALISRELGLRTIPWHNPAVSETGANNTIALQFDEFLNRGGQFGSLEFDHTTTPTVDVGHRVLVIEEFPATLTGSSNVLHSFRSVILQFLARSTSSTAFRGRQTTTETPPAVVVIISETLLSSSTALADSFTAHRLLGPEILNHPYVTVMDFNPVAPTFVTKALDLVMKKEARNSRRRRMPGPAVIQKLAEVGDVRSAVNSLEFLCLRGGDDSGWSGTVAATRAKKGAAKEKKGASLTEMETNSLCLVGPRETTLDMFHATGKVVYNKREDPRVLDTRAAPPPKPPDHLGHLYTPKASLVDVDALWNETGTDIPTFISTLHENHVLSCNGDTFETSFDACADVLSVCDVLNPVRRGPRRGHSNANNAVQAHLQAGTSDTLRQDEISFHVATRGLLFHLPHPVNRASPPGARRGDGFKMFYPAGLRLWKPTEETEGLVDIFVRGTGRAGQTVHGMTGPAPSNAGVAGWTTRSFVGPARVKREGSPPSLDRGDDDGGDDGDDQNLAPIHHAKDTLVLEVLPLMTRIFEARHRDVAVLARITKFKASGFVAEEGFEDDDVSDRVGQASTAGAAGAAAATGNGAGPTSSSVFGKKTLPVSGAATTTTTTTTPQAPVDTPSVEKLYISDDDIEDD